MTTMHARQASLTALEESRVRGEPPELHPDNLRCSSQITMFTLRRNFASSWAYVVNGISNLSNCRPSRSFFKRSPSRFRIAMSRRQICVAVS